MLNYCTYISAIALVQFPTMKTRELSDRIRNWAQATKLLLCKRTTRTDSRWLLHGVLCERSLFKRYTINFIGLDDTIDNLNQIVHTSILPKQECGAKIKKKNNKFAWTKPLMIFYKSSHHEVSYNCEVIVSLFCLFYSCCSLFIQEYRNLSKEYQCPTDSVPFENAFRWPNATNLQCAIFMWKYWTQKFIFYTLPATNNWMSHSCVDLPRIFWTANFAIILQNVYIVRVNSVFPLWPNMIKLELKNAKFDVVPEEEAQLQYMPAAIASNAPANISTFFNNYTEEVDGSKSRLWNKCGLFFVFFLLLKWASAKRINPNSIKVP